MNAPTIWPAGIRTDDEGRASLYDLLSAAGVASPRSRWSRIAGRRPDLAAAVVSVVLTGARHPTPMVTAAVWSMVLAEHTSTSSAGETLVVDGGETLASVSPQISGNVGTVGETLVVDGGETLAPTVTLPGDAAPTVTETADGDDAIDDAEEELERHQSLYSPAELKWWSTEAESRRVIAEEHRARLALPQQTKTVAPKKHNMSMEEVVTRRIEARAAKEATARAAIAATPPAPINDDYVDDGKPIVADDDDGYGQPDFDEGDDTDETDSPTPKWWSRAAE